MFTISRTNGINTLMGKFTHSGKAYRINALETPERWNNPLFNDSYLADVSQTLQGKSMFFNGNKQQDYTAGCRHFYLLDRDTGDVFCPCYVPLKTTSEVFFCEHHLGHSVLIAEKDGIKTTIRVFVPAESKAEVWTLTLENKNDSVKNISPTGSIRNKQQILPRISNPLCKKRPPMRRLKGILPILPKGKIPLSENAA